MRPGEHIGKSYRPTGPKLLSPYDVADVFAKILNRKVSYKPVSFKQFHKAAIAMGFPTEQVAHIRYYAQEVQAGVYERSAPTEHTELVTGSPPEPFEVTAERYIKNPSLVNPGLEIGSRFAAFRLLARIVMARPFDLRAWEEDRGYPLIENPTLAHECENWLRASEQGRINIDLSGARSARVRGSGETPRTRGMPAAMTGAASV